MKTAILTYCDANYEKNLINDFCKTLKDVGYKGQLCILDYGLTEYVEPLLEEMEAPYEFKIIKCKKERSVEANRNKDIVRVLNMIDADTVMTIDAGDVWFQENFDEVFEMTKDGLGYVEEDNANHPDGLMWTINRIKALPDSSYKNIALELLIRRRTIGSGMIVGKTFILKKVLEATWQITKELGADYFGVDQIAFNLAIRMNEHGNNGFMSLPQTYDYVTITHQKDAHYEEGILMDKDKVPVKIAHNAGGQNRLINREEQWK